MSSQVLSTLDPVGTVTPVQAAADCLDALETAIGNLAADFDGEEKWGVLVECRRQAARALAQLPKRSGRTPEVTRALALVGRLAGLGVQDRPLEVEDEDWLQARESRDWPVVLGVMVLTSGWQWAQAPLLGAVPDWLWGDYAAWLFAPPRNWRRPGDPDSYAAHAGRHLEELTRWLSRNAGSAAVRAAVEAYRRVAGLVPQEHALSHRRRHAEARGRFLARHLGAGPAIRYKTPAPRVGRRLRIGFVNHGFGPQADLRTMQPAYARLDARSFETILISLSLDDAELAKESAGKTPAVAVLAPDFRGRIANLRSLNLDVIVYGTDLANRLDEITELASQRVAPLQVVHHRSGLTTGLPEMDLLVVGEQPDIEGRVSGFTERLGVRRGPALTFALAAGTGGGSGAEARAQLGLPAGVPLFAAVVSGLGVPGATLHGWARLLAHRPESRLVLARETDQADPQAAAGLAALGHEIGRVFAAHSVATDRVAIFPVPTGAQNELRTLLGVADLYLDGPAGSDPLWAVEALAQGRPVIALAGDAPASHGGSAWLLSSLGLEELIAADEVTYETLAAQLAANPEQREAVAARIQSALESAPAVLDQLAASDGFGALMETAFDELAALGLEQFRAQREPLRCFAPEEGAETVAAGEAALAAGDLEAAGAEAGLALRADPRDAGARSLRGRVLLAEGEPARAVTYLLAAVEQRSDDAALWFALAGALRQNQQGAEAVQALEASLRLDRSQVEAWLLLLDIAESGGAVEIAAEARNVLREIAPDDPRVAVLA